jgi:hypothetical protein
VTLIAFFLGFACCAVVVSHSLKRRDKTNLSPQRLNTRGPFHWRDHSGRSG